MTITEQELKPCILCKGVNLKITKQKWNSLTDWYILGCIDCKIRVPGLSREKLIEKWNTRAHDAELEELRRVKGNLLELINELKLIKVQAANGEWVEDKPKKPKEILDATIEMLEGLLK
jgi:hypothetical protein